MTQLPDWYLNWAIEHATAFGWRDDDVKSALSWGRVFADLFTKSELHEATTWLIADPKVPRYADQHRSLVITTIAQLRKKSRSREQATESYATGRCAACEGTGWVIVPHPGSDPNGRLNRSMEWPADNPRSISAYMAVTCHLCQIGTQTREVTDSRGRRPMSFTTYSESYPDWEEVERRRKEIRQLTQHESPANLDPEQVRDAIRRMANRTKLPPRK